MPSRDDSSRLRRDAKRRGRLGSLGYHLGMIAVCAVVLYPAVWMFTSSLKPSSEIIGNISLLPENGSLDNFATALAGIGGVSFWTFFVNSVIIAVFSVVGVVVSSAVAAYAFARIQFRAKPLWFALMVATMLLPFHVTIIPQYILFQNLGLINNFGALLIPKFLATEAFFVFLMIQFLRGIPRDLDEAARIDGAGHIRVFGSIIMPLLRPAMITAAIFTFIASWNDFLGPLLYLKRPDLYTLPIALRLFVDQTTTSDYGAQVAMAVLALIPVIIFFFVFQRYLIDGVSTQGLKG
ncbi:carbohydrate ABC transporter permease [Ruania halotolerans]|uniref:carbohydrate ABC transporter permease n=1 Tax=Ruania halotolerans TaxID=2897773 RepID=UPI001E3F2F0D|nr:carbohydrate ABC transporter permease [Ruania halotolerans]UFU08446.1 carbohydrate ABC transporter permease [Ruania halotolerans]